MRSLADLFATILGASALYGIACGQTICIDPGHPSEVGSGTEGKRSTEKQVAWAIAQDLTKKLREYGYAVVLTKARENQNVKNRRRAEIANLFIGRMNKRLDAIGEKFSVADVDGSPVSTASGDAPELVGVVILGADGSFFTSVSANGSG
jgi:hypothetical protein